MRKSEILRLNNIQLLSDLPLEEIKLIQKKCIFFQYEEDEQILDRNSESRDIFFVVQGNVQVKNFSFSGREIALASIGAGGYFGELSAIDQKARSASVLATQTTIVARLNPKHFMELIRRYPSISQRVLQRLAQIIRNCDERIMDLSTLGAVQRVYIELLRLAQQTTEGEWVIEPVPMQTNVAARASTTRETVARVFSQMRKSNLMIRKGKTLEIKDYSKLQLMAERLPNKEGDLISR